MRRLETNARRMLRRRGPYDWFCAILTLALLASGAWLAALTVAAFLVWIEDRLVGEGS